jgi:hypothetical protein
MFDPANAVTGLTVGPDGALYVLVGPTIVRIGR